jgi:DNA-binding transcriptional LysR family regulator
VRIGPLPDSSLTATPVGHIRRVVVASPAYLARHGTPRHPSELAGHATVSAYGAQQGASWCFGGGLEVPVRSRLSVTSFPAAIDAAVAGAGLTQVASYQVAAAVARGELRLVLERFEVPPRPVHVVYAEGRRGSAKVRSFVDFCAARLRASLAALAGPATVPSTGR